MNLCRLQGETRRERIQRFPGQGRQTRGPRRRRVTVITDSHRLSSRLIVVPVGGRLVSKQTTGSKMVTISTILCTQR